MDEEIERLVIGVRADTGGFAADVSAMSGSLKGSLGDAADTAGRRIETALSRALVSGKLGFDDLAKVALSVLDTIATAAVKGAIGGGGGDGGLLSGLAGLVSSLGGAPGRATGGPVSPGRAYRVGENGPELFVPTASGRIETGGSSAARDVRVAITVNAGQSDAPAALARSGRQVARAVRAALVGAGG